jgi:hypothetical protein
MNSNHVYTEDSDIIVSLYDYMNNEQKGSDLSNKW